MQYVGLGQTGFYEPFFYLGNRLAKIRDQQLQREQFEFEKTQQAPLNLATIGQKEAEAAKTRADIELIKAQQRTADRMAEAAAKEAENKAALSSAMLPMQQARAKAGASMFGGDIIPGMQLQPPAPPEPGGFDESMARGIAPIGAPSAPSGPPKPLSLQPGLSLTPPSASGSRVGAAPMPAPGGITPPSGSMNIRMAPAITSPTGGLGNLQSRIVPGKEGMPEIQNIESGLTPLESQAVQEAVNSPTGESTTLASLPENRRKQVQDVIDAKRIALVAKQEESRVRAEKAKAGLAELDLKFGSESNRERQSTEERALKAAYENLQKLRQTVQGYGSFEASTWPFSKFGSNPQAAANLNNLPTMIADDLTKLLSNPGAGTQPAVVKQYSSISPGFFSTPGVVLSSIDQQQERLLEWVRSIENNPTTKRPFTGLSPELRQKIGPTAAYTPEWQQYDAQLVQAVPRTVEMVGPQGQIGKFAENDVAKQEAAGWARRGVRKPTGTKPVSLAPQIQKPAPAHRESPM